MEISRMELFATLSFTLAIVHTFCIGMFHRWAERVGLTTKRGKLLHFAGEVEVVFGIWAILFFLITAITEGFSGTITYIEQRNYTEPLFIFVILAVSATRPILYVANRIILGISKRIPLQPAMSFYLTAMVIGPLLGSFITEPAAMTVTALLLKDTYFSNSSERFKYITLGLLFVNVSIGGVLTPYAAPPVLMVARVWDWDFIFMLQHFGWKAILSVFVATGITITMLRKEFSMPIQESTETEPPMWVSAMNIVFLALIVASAHHPAIFVALFLLFLAATQLSQDYDEGLKLREGLFVAIFLSGLVILGGLQQWWLNPLLHKMTDSLVFVGAIILTAVTDNAALTYLGAQASDLSNSFKYFLVAGAVTGGGLTVIANAPNPIGYSILGKHFGGSISALKLFKAALIPTIVAALIFYFF